MLLLRRGCTRNSEARVAGSRNVPPDSAEDRLSVFPTTAVKNSTIGQGDLHSISRLSYQNQCRCTTHASNHSYWKCSRVKYGMVYWQGDPRSGRSSHVSSMAALLLCSGTFHLSFPFPFWSRRTKMEKMGSAELLHGRIKPLIQVSDDGCRQRGAWRQWLVRARRRPLAAPGLVRLSSIRRKLCYGIGKEICFMKFLIFCYQTIS